MGILRALANQSKAEEYALLLQASLTYGEDVKKFAADHLLPVYLACGKGYEPADLNEDLLKQFNCNTN